MARLVELSRASQAGRTGADDGNPTAGAMLRRLGHNPAFLEAFIDDRLLDRFDRHGLSDQPYCT
ncbi:hypothetical protein D1872_341360 [compost metagenome]